MSKRARILIAGFAAAIALAAAPKLSAQDLAAPIAPRRVPPPEPVEPGVVTDGAIVAAARGGTRLPAGSEETLRYVARDSADPFQRPARSERPVGVRLFLIAFW
jgi:hypothetical protein